MATFPLGEVSVITRMSYVHARGFSCEVTTIQPVDYPRMLRDLRQKQPQAAQGDTAR